MSDNDAFLFDSVKKALLKPVARRRRKREVTYVDDLDMRKVIPDPENYLVINPLKLEQMLLKGDASLNTDALLLGY